MQKFLYLGKWAGVPVRFHWTVLLAIPWFWYYFHGFLNALIALPSYIILIVVHEFGHAAVARWRNVRVDGIEVFAIHGVCRHKTLFREKDIVLIAWGGVAAQLVLLALAGLALIPLSFAPDIVRFYAAPVRAVLIPLNVWTMVINLLPVAPLDGNRAWRALFWIKSWLSTKLPWIRNTGVEPGSKARPRFEEASERTAADVLNKVWYLGQCAGVPVSVHWSVLLVFPWLYIVLGNWLAALIASVAYFLLLIAHEAGHVAVARWCGSAVHGVTFSMVHGETAHSYPRSALDDIFIAWGGVAAQTVILVLAVVADHYLRTFANPAVAIVANPVLRVFIGWNVFLMLMALLPLGSMDGRRAWAVIPWLRQRFRRRGSSGGKVVKLDPAKRRALQQKSEKAAADILQNLGKKK